MPLWFWMVWQVIGLGLMAFGVASLVKAIWENKKGPAGRQPGQSKEKTNHYDDNTKEGKCQMVIMKSENTDYMCGCVVCAICYNPISNEKLQYARSQYGKEYREYSCECGNKIKVWMEEGNHG